MSPVARWGLGQHWAWWVGFGVERTLISKENFKTGESQQVEESSCFADSGSSWASRAIVIS